MELSERGARFLLGLMLLFALAAAWILWPFLTYVAMGLVVAYLARTPYAWLATRVRRRGIAAGIVVLALVVLLLGPFALFGWLVWDDALAAARGFAGGDTERELEGTLTGFGVPGSQAARVVDTVLASVQAAVARLVRELFASSGKILVGLFVFYFVVFYALVDGERLTSFFRRAAPLTDRRMDALFDETGRAVTAIFRGHVLVSLVQGLAAGVGWWLFGLPDPITWGFVATLLALLPYVGAAFVVVPAGLWLAFQGDVVRGVAFALYGVLVVGMVDNLLRPWLIGRTAEIHPVFVLVGILGGLATFGLAGLFIGPLVLVLLRAVLLVWARREESQPAHAA